MKKPSNNVDRAKAKYLAKGMVRLFNATTGEYLHLSGSGVTTNVHHAWLGFMHQARRLRSAATERGEEWPFSTIRRDITDRKQEPV